VETGGDRCRKSTDRHSSLRNQLHTTSARIHHTSDSVCAKPALHCNRTIRHGQTNSPAVNSPTANFSKAHIMVFMFLANFFSDHDYVTLLLSRSLTCYLLQSAQGFYRRSTMKMTLNVTKRIRQSCARFLSVVRSHMRSGDKSCTRVQLLSTVTLIILIIIIQDYAVKV